MGWLIDRFIIVSYNWFFSTTVELLFNTENEQVISCQLPKYVILKVKYTEPGIKGDPATHTLKDCVLETNEKTKEQTNI